MITIEKRIQVLNKMRDSMEEKIVEMDLDTKNLNRLLINKNDKSFVTYQLSQVQEQKEVWENLLLVIEEELKILNN